VRARLAGAEGEAKMKIAVIVSLVLFATCYPTLAVSEQITLACKFEGSERPGPEREKDVNQIRNHPSEKCPTVITESANSHGVNNPLPKQRPLLEWLTGDRHRRHKAKRKKSFRRSTRHNRAQRKSKS
jgi:hypothetical protein